uniref:Uncharacterized protein n=1 Tax=Panagrolaimus superbus TaxID=310955 RepID=A0A914Y9C4_9BILA
MLRFKAHLINKCSLKKNMISEVSSDSSLADDEDTRSDQMSESDSEKHELATPSTNYFVQLSQKFEARPKIQKLGEKLKTVSFLNE